MTMRESDTYRRGLTLGLTMAEIFILLLFLLLLVLLALYAVNFEQEKELQSATEDIEKTQIELDAANTKSEEQQGTIDNLITKSANATEKNQSLIKENKHLVGALDAANTKSEEQQGTIDNFSTQLANATEKNQSLIKENKHLVGALVVANTISGGLQKKLEETEDKNKSLQKIIDELRDQLAKAKGIDPPCWYKATTRNGEHHEEPYYLMDVAVYNEYLQIRMREAPPGYALDESEQKATTSYREEYEKLPLPPSGTNKKVSLHEFATMTEPIKRMGKNKQIRDYACVFYAKVWDFTAATAKIRWKKAEDIIKNNFYILRINNDPWSQTHQ